MKNQASKSESRTIKVAATQSIVERWLSSQESADFEQDSNVADMVRERQIHHEGPLYKRLHEVEEATRAILSIEPALLKQDWAEAIRLLDYAAECMDVQTLLNRVMTIEFAHRILSYPFPEIVVSDPDLLNQFRARRSYIALLEASLISPGQWLPQREMVAVLLGSDYDLVLDPDRIHKEGFDNRPDMVKFLPEPHSTTLKERLVHCPVYHEFAQLSTKGRRGVYYILHCNFRGRIANGACLQKYLHEDHNDARSECTLAGFVDGDLSPVSYLPYLTNDVLKSVLQLNGIKPANTKSQLIDAIVRAVPADAVTKYVSHFVSEGDLRICFQSGKLRQMLHSEEERFSRWEVWLRKTLLQEQRLVYQPLPVTTVARESYLSRARFKAVLRFSPLTLHKVSQLSVWKDYWDKQSDNFVSEYGRKLGWNAFKEAAKAVSAYWGIEKTARFDSETHSFKKELDLLGFGAEYNSVLELYCEARRIELGIGGPTPQTRLCDWCRKEFREDSIPPNLAELAGYYLGFCRDCLDQAFYRLIYSDAVSNPSREELIDKIKDLCNVFGQVPQAKFVQDPRLPIGIQPDRAVKLIKALVTFPVYAAFVNKFGSWFKALVAANVFDDEPIRMARGYKGLAADGHECFSLAELTIDNWLSSHAIPHEREPLYPFHSTLNPNGKSRADWKVGYSYIEYFGMMLQSEYRIKAEAKMKLAAEMNLLLLIIMPEDLVNLDEKMNFLQYMVSSGD